MYEWSQIPSRLLHKIVNDAEKVWECYLCERKEEMAQCLAKEEQEMLPCTLVGIVVYFLTSRQSDRVDIKLQ